ncbi:MAG: YHS domain-containing (seleno)protein [Phycisphaerales bacterium JB043]
MPTNMRAALLVTLGLVLAPIGGDPILGQTQQGAPTQAGADAAEVIRNTDEWSLKRGLAIEGYDPVAYFPEGGGVPRKGDKNIAYTLEGVTYRFASASHRELFVANPRRYEPAYGGWCAWAMKDGDKTKINPKSFLVVQDRLFLFYDGLFGDTRMRWLNKNDHDIQAIAADDQWMRISGESPRVDDAQDRSAENQETH